MTYADICREASRDYANRVNAATGIGALPAIIEVNSRRAARLAELADLLDSLYPAKEQPALIDFTRFPELTATLPDLPV